jgi:hypothetical protein
MRGEEGFSLDYSAKVQLGQRTSREAPKRNTGAGEQSVKFGSD